MKRRLVLAAAILLVLPSLLLSRAGAAGSKEPVIIGLEVPLSPPGDVAAGQLIRRGAELAVDYYNSKGGVLGGRPLQLEVSDTAGQPEQGVAGYRQLVTQKHAVAVTGFFHSSVNLAVNEVAKDMGVATIGTQTGATDVTAKGYAVAFRTHSINPVRVTAWLSLIKQKHWKKISLIAEDTDYGVGLVKETEGQNQAQHLGLQIQSIVFDHTTTDLTPQLLQVKAFKPDLVINIGVGQPADLMLDQAHTLGILPQTPMLISYDEPIRPEFWQVHAQDGNGVYFIAYYSPQEKLSKLGQWMADAYQKKYNEAPIYSSLNGFGDVAIIAQAVEKAKSTDPAAVVKALETGKFQSWADSDVNFPAAKGVYWHNWSPPILILQYTAANQKWQDAKLILAEKGIAAK